MARVLRAALKLTSAIESDGALYHSVDKLAHNFQLFIIPES